MFFAEFETLATDRGLKARSLDNSKHWQVIGETCTVNYWPNTGSIHIKGAAHKVPGRFHRPMKAIEFALRELPTHQGAVRRKKTKDCSQVRHANNDYLRAKLRSVTKEAVVWQHAYRGAVDELSDLKMELSKRDQPRS